MAGAMAAGVRRGQKRVLYPEDIGTDGNDLLVLDTRSADEYAVSHIPGSVNIPDEEVRKRVAELPRDKRIAIVCQIGIKANNVQRFLELQGYEAYTVMGGYTAWMMAMDRLPVPAKKNGTAAAETSADLPDRRTRRDRRASNDRRVTAGTGPNGIERRSGSDRRQLSSRRQPWSGKELDVRGLCCPGPILKLHEQMTELSTGQLLRVQASDPAFPADLEVWAKRTGVRVVYVASAPNHSVAVCEKRR